MTRTCSVTACAKRTVLLSLLILASILAPASALAASKRQVNNWIRQLKSEDPVKSSSAAASLLASDDERALKALLDALDPGHPDSVRISVITAFQTYDDDRATQGLIATIEAKSDAVRQTAIEALQSINTPTAVLYLEEAALNKDRPPQTRSQIITILGEMRTIDAINTLIDLLSDSEESVRKAARTALERITLRSYDTVSEWQAWKRNHEALSREAMLEEQVRLQSERIRYQSQLIEKLYVRVLEGRADRNDPTPLIEALSESNLPKVQLYAIKQMVALKDLTEAQSKLVTSALLTALDYPAGSVRQAVATALATHGNGEVIPDLVKALDDPITSVRIAAVTSLGALKAREATQPLCALLKSQPEDVAAAAAQALGAMGDRGGVNALIEAVTIPDAPPKLYEAATAALVKIGDARAVPVFMKLLKSPDDVVRQDAVTALGRLKVERAAKGIAEVAANDSKPPIRVAAIAALAKIGGPVAFDATIAALSDKDKSVADQALLSLVQIADGKSAPYEAALERLLNEHQYELAEAVLARAVNQFTAMPNHVAEIAQLRWTMAQRLMESGEYARAKAQLETLSSSEQRNTTYVVALSDCLLELGDYKAAVALLAPSRADENSSATAWQETLKIAKKVAADKTASPQRIIDIVDALEKEDETLGGEANAASFKDLRDKAKRLQNPTTD